MSDEIPKSRIENLPNELWIEIFNYLDWINLFSAFYGISTRINQLLVSTNILSIYSSWLINYHNSVYLCFIEFPLKEFKHLNYFRLIYDDEYDESLDITKQFTSFSNLVSLVLEANCGENGGSDEFQMFIFRQKFPYLRRLYLGGNVFDHGLQISYAEFKSNFPSLLYLHVGRLHINFALQILDEYRQLSSFSAKLYCNTATDTITPFNTHLLALKVLKLRGDTDFGNEFGTQFLERFLPCCPNIHTFMFEIHCYDNWERLLQANWWPHALVSNTKLKKLAFHLQWATRINFHRWGDEVERFRISPFFIGLNTTVRSDFHSEFMRRITVDVYIQN